MKKSDIIISKIFLYGLPVVFGLGVFSILYEKGFFKFPDSGLTSVWHGLSGLALGLWMSLTVYLAIRLLISETFREGVLTKITFMKERDEREELLTGKATKGTFLMTLALLFFLLCLSCFQVSIYRLPSEKAINGKTGVLTLGTNIILSQKQAMLAPPQENYRKNIFSYNLFPISTTGVILLLIIWHIFWYNFFMRRMTK
ncbi:MAG: hypothetical protein PHW54_05775 [Candidatus Omnitrophica bacterium]|nr:hypothetical protein [Candidatus Omnitrophota bacterium]